MTTKGSDLDRLVGALAGRSDPPLTPLELAEGIWLAAGLFPSRTREEVEIREEGEGDYEEDPTIPEAAKKPWDAEPAGPNAARKGVPGPDTAQPGDVLEDAAVPVGLPSAEGAGGWREQALALDVVQTLEDPVGQASGVARLAQRRNRPELRQFDLATTIQWSCRAGEPLVATRPVVQASTHLVLLVDTSPTMTPWGRATALLEELVRSTVGMRARTLLRLDLSGPPVMFSSAGPVQAPHVARTGLDTQILLWTDGLAPGFSALGPLLQSFPAGTRVAWLHPWPRSAWRRTPLGRMRHVRPGGTAPGADAVPVVVVTPGKAGWAAVGAMLRGRVPRGAPVVGMPAVPPDRPLAPPAPNPGDTDGWRSHVERMLGTLRPESVRLVGLLAALPTETFDFDAVQALAGQAGLDTTPFVLVEALTSGLLCLAEGSGARLRFRDDGARRRAQLLLDLPDLQRVLDFAHVQAGGGPPAGPGRAAFEVLAAGAQGGEVTATPSEATVTLLGPAATPAEVAPAFVAPPTPPPAPPRDSPAKRVLMTLPKLIQPVLKALDKDLLGRARLPEVEAGLRAAWNAEKKAGETGQGFDPWRRARVTQIAVAWVLSVVFVRTLEDRGFIDPRIAGLDATGLAAARDREASFVQIAPFLGPREYLLTVFEELSHLPGAREVFDARHNPVWVLSPSGEGARALLDFFQREGAATGAPALVFPGTDSRFLGDLYQDLSEAVRKRYALLQTPDFVERFILEQTLHPAIEAFGLGEVRLIDPTCGSGHFLLGAFRDLLERWRQADPGTPVEELARRALGQVHGVDVNPYAVAIARFRLVLAVLDAVGVTRLDRAPELRPKVVVADSLLHRMAAQQRLSQQVSMAEWASWGDALFRLSDPGAVAEVLEQRYHAVVGNPPYITEKDATKRNKYREMYESAAGKYALAAPFTERFFDLAVSGGFVGMINSNAWTKRDYGKTLIEKVLPRLDVQKIIDTSGCYLPGHGTPTLLLFGRNRRPSGFDVVAVLGKRGEQEVPQGDPAEAPVWAEIVEHHEQTGFEGERISVEQVSRKQASAHPWVLAGGGARPLLIETLEPGGIPLGVIAQSVGILTVTGEDAVFPQKEQVHRRNGVCPIRPMVEGDVISDWMALPSSYVPWMYDDSFRVRPAADIPEIIRFLWPSKAVISRRRRFGVPMLERGYSWYELQELYASKLSSPLTIAFALVTTHFRPVLYREFSLFKNSAPIIKLQAHHTEPDHQALLGYLNSSTVGFWCRLVMFPKGGDQVGDGARLSKTPWQDRLEYAGNLLQQLPVPDLARLRDSLLDLVVTAEETVAAISALSPDKTVAATLAETPTLAALCDVRDRTHAERARLRGILVSLQEEMDWRVYGLFGLPTVTADSVDAVRVPVEPNHRPFEVRLAREVDSDISASEWFRIHQRDAPADVGGPLAELYGQRLRLLDHPERGRQLRLLETPETKRRWSPPDEPRAFRDAVGTWLFERVEAAFRDQPQPELRTARQLALDLGRDPAVAAAHELLTEETGLDLVRLISNLVDAEGVPFLAGWRYAETGMEKRAQWEETWRLQRLEDAGALAPELKRLGLDAIPVPDKYTNKDFNRHFWGLRGKLDVPKERFVTVPGGTTDDDPTPLVGWAGWDHLQTSLALATLYQRRKLEDGWTGDRLVPLLAGIAERVPWLLQWHNDYDDATGHKLGEYYRTFVTGQARELGVAYDPTKPTDDLRAWTPPAAPKRTAVAPDELLAALLAWTPGVDEDAEDGDDSEPPEGPTLAELAGVVGAALAKVRSALKALEKDGRVEKLDGRPARYVATGD